MKQELKSGLIGRSWLQLLGFVSMVKSEVSRIGKRVWNVGADDPRKVVHGIKVGIALSLVSLFYYIRPLYDGVGGAAMWAVMTVVVVLDFTVGGCLYRGFNRAIATLTAGALAVGLHWIASKLGETAEHIIIGALVFLLSSGGTFIRFMPTIKSRFDYGVAVFILTFSLVAVSGYRVDGLLEMAQRRASTIAIGVSICMLVCILVRPVWAGVDLHLLITCNLEKLADSLEECVAKYFKEGGKVGGKEPPSQKSQGYKCVLNSKASEESLAKLAKWEPAHGRFRFRHLWSQYLKVGAATRYCAYLIEAFNGCIQSDTQVSESIKKRLTDACTKLSSDVAKVLKELADSDKSMKKSSSIDYLVLETNNAVEELQDAFRSLLQAEKGTEEKRQPTLMVGMSLIEALPLITMCSLLIEISERIEGVVDAVDELAVLSFFESTGDEKIEHTKLTDNPPSSIALQVQDAIP